MRKKIIIQGYPGSFHDVACQAYFQHDELEVLPADSFNFLGEQIYSNPKLDYGIMAIENSIAGSILQNYRILREYNLSVIGEIYLRIEHCLMALPGQAIEQITEVHSHPMAINQCRAFFENYPKLKLIDKEDTALSAKLISEKNLKNVAAIASLRASELYGLEVLESGIEDNKQNYTRFFVIQKNKSEIQVADKASIWLRIEHQKGSLLDVLKVIAAHNINLTKLQSFPVLGELSQYFFHLDLEFETLESYTECTTVLKNTCSEFKELGCYKRADISLALRQELTNVML